MKKSDYIILFLLCGMFLQTYIIADQASDKQLLESELETSQLYYSYAKEMLDGFMYDKEIMKDAVKAIRESSNGSI